MNTIWAADPLPGPPDTENATGNATENATGNTGSPVELRQLKTRLEEQQKQIETLRAALEQQKRMLEKVEAMALAAAPQRTAPGEALAPAAASSLAVLQAAAPQPQANSVVAGPVAQGSEGATEAMQKAIDGINRNLGGFRFSGDFRYRLDLQLRSSNSVAGPLQNTRGRYRVRLNVDKELVSGLTAHAQISTGPYSNYTTNDEDWAGVAAKVPFSLAEAWLKYTRHDFSIRAGRMEEVFADNNRFLWDDDIRFNGVEARYNLGLNQNNSLEFRAGVYVLTNPNTPVVAAGSPYLGIGYQVGQKVRDASMFHPGLIFKTKSGAWTNQFYSDLTWIHNADQIQLASTAAGFPVLVNNALGITLSGPVGQTGNATTTPGGPLYAARHWQILKAGYRLDYAAMKWGSRPMPFWADFQGLFNAGTGSDRSAMMATLNFGQIRKFGDVRFLYQISRKEANSMISQFTDDDLGTQTGVNTRVNSIRFDVGFTRFLQWQNILFIQQPLTGSRPGFYVTLPAGANTTYRYLGQLAFAF